MSSTPKSKRKDHDFNTTKEMKRLRFDITAMAINDFGYDRERYERQIERIRKARENDQDINQIIAKMRLKQESFFDEFIRFEKKEVLKMWRDISAEFERGNRVFPSGEAAREEYIERRLHLDRCIGHIFELQIELEYIAETLPVDKNKYANLGERIKTLAKMVKGVRQYSNRFLKAKPANAD